MKDKEMKRRKERSKEGNKREENKEASKGVKEKTIWKLYFHFAQPGSGLV